MPWMAAVADCAAWRVCPIPGSGRTVTCPAGAAGPALGEEVTRRKGLCRNGVSPGRVAGRRHRPGAGADAAPAGRLGGCLRGGRCHGPRGADRPVAGPAARRSLGRAPADGHRRPGAAPRSRLRPVRRAARAKLPATRPTPSSPGSGPAACRDTGLPVEAVLAADGTEVQICWPGSGACGGEQSGRLGRGSGGFRGSSGAYESPSCRRELRPELLPLRVRSLPLELDLSEPAPLPARCGH